jgi:protoporphyrinogen oxidase
MASESAGSTNGLAEQRIVIIGAGPTGLGAACRLVELGLSNFLVVEQEEHAGGLASSFRDPAGFTWDVGGHVQFSHYHYFDQAMDRALGDAWLHHDREAWVWIGGRFVPYPLQNNIHLLPDAEKRSCLIGLLRRAPVASAPANFDAWIEARFGSGLADVFMRPYNRKVWAYPPADLDVGWMGERVAEVDLERVILNLVDGRPDVGWGPNNRFRFPARGGTGAIWRSLAAQLPRGAVRYGAQVAAVDLAGRHVQLTDGTRLDYDRLLSTMPLDTLARHTGSPPLIENAARLKYSTVHIFGVGLAGEPPASLARKCWIYFPEADCPYYRLTVFSNYSPANVPDGQYWSVMVEVSESPAKPVDRDCLQDQVLEGLLATRIITTRDVIVSIWHRTAAHGYPTPFLGRDGVVMPMLRELERHEVYSRGRFGAWKYEVSNQDHSFMQGVEVVDRWALGRDETTLEQPAVVNGARR